MCVVCIGMCLGDVGVLCCDVYVEVVLVDLYECVVCMYELVVVDEYMFDCVGDVW